MYDNLAHAPNPHNHAIVACSSQAFVPKWHSVTSSPFMVAHLSQPFHLAPVGRLLLRELEGVM
eukprot:67018-Amphidinium_carterae.1